MARRPPPSNPRSASPRRARARYEICFTLANAFTVGAVSGGDRAWEWRGRRVVALDQRGHGQSDHAPSSSWRDYVGDIGAFLEHLGVEDPVVLLGNSLGGTAGFMFAADLPERVRALIAEEAPAKQEVELGFMLPWQGVFPTRQALLDRVGKRLAWSVEPSIRDVPGGFSLAFSPKELVERQPQLNGDFWREC